MTSNIYLIIIIIFFEKPQKMLQVDSRKLGNKIYQCINCDDFSSGQTLSKMFDHSPTNKIFYSV